MDNVSENLSRTKQNVSAHCEPFVICLLDERIGLKEHFLVLPEHTLGQILDAVYDLLDIKRPSNLYAFEMSDGEIIVDEDVTVAEAGLRAGDTLTAIIYYRGVA